MQEHTQAKTSCWCRLIFKSSKHPHWSNDQFYYSDCERMYFNKIPTKTGMRKMGRGVGLRHILAFTAVSGVGLRPTLATFETSQDSLVSFSGPSCSKLTTSLVNVSLKFQTLADICLTNLCLNDIVKITMLCTTECFFLGVSRFHPSTDWPILLSAEIILKGM